MTEKPIYEECEKRVKKLEEKNLKGFTEGKV